MTTSQQLKRPYTKPKWQVPLGLAKSIVAYNCQKHGFPIPTIAMPMWEGAGNKVYDVSGDHHGTLVNHTKWTGDNFGTAMSFDGIDDYIIDEPVNYLTYPTEITILAQCRNRTTSSNSLFWASIYNDNTTPRLNAHIPYGGTVYWHFGIINSGGALTKTAPTDLTTKPHNWGFWASGGNLKIYLDGNEWASGAGDPNGYTSTDRLYIGCAILNVVVPSLFYPGIVSGFCLFNSALTPRQMKFANDNPFFMYEIPEELWDSSVLSSYPGWYSSYGGWT